MKKFIFFIIAFVNALNASGQILQRMALRSSDSLNNVKYRYEYLGKDDFYRVAIFLLKDGSYRYYKNGFDKDLYSKGTWKETKGNVVLNSEIQKSNVPVSLSFTNDTLDVVNDFKFGVVRNLKGDYLTDAFVNINNDSVRCLPMAGSCIGNYETIDSVRLIFENGFTSQWMHVKNDNHSHILFKVNTDLDISSFVSFQNFEYKFTKKYMKPIVEND